MTEPAYLGEARQLSFAALGVPGAPSDVLRRVLASPTVASKRWVYRQYDHMVRTNTLVLPGMGAAVVRMKGTTRALAMSVDGNGRFVYLDPYAGAQLAVAEAARNVACAGAVPIGATNCLNFGSPERPEIMWQFAKAVEGMAHACRVLGFRSPAATSACTTRRTAGPCFPHPSLAWSACSRTRRASCNGRFAPPATSSCCSARRAATWRQRVPQRDARRDSRRSPGARSRGSRRRCTEC